MSGKYCGPEAVTYGMIRGSALKVRQEFDSVLERIKDCAGKGVHSCVCFLNNVPSFETAPDDVILGCKHRRTLQNNLINCDGQPELGNRVDALAEHFRQSIRYFGKAGNVKTLDELMALFDEMESQNPPVLPDRRTLYAGRRVCKTWRDFDSLNERVVKYKIPVDMIFFNDWLETASTFQEIAWVCGRASDAGYPDLNHRSRDVFWGLCRGREGVSGCKALPMLEIVSLRDWILSNRKGDIWTYIVEKLINPITVGFETHLRGAGHPSRMVDNRGVSPLGVPLRVRGDRFFDRPLPGVVRRRNGVVLNPSDGK